MHLEAPLSFQSKLPSTLRILVVEDSTINQRLAQHIFQRLGCIVETADTGHDALQAFDRGIYHLVLMDCRLPGLDGFACTRRIRDIESKRTSDYRTPIVALTAYAPPDYRERCLRAGMNDCYIKPLRRDLVTKMLGWVTEPPPQRVASSPSMLTS